MARSLTTRFPIVVTEIAGNTWLGAVVVAVAGSVAAFAVSAKLGWPRQIAAINAGNT